MKLYKSIILFCLVVVLTGCASTVVTRMDNEAVYSSGACEVKVYQSRAMALNDGAIIEACAVTGSSAFSFDHSIEGAIKKNIDEVCECGVNLAFVESRQTETTMGITGVSYVTLIGFSRSSE